MWSPSSPSSSSSSASPFGPGPSTSAGHADRAVDDARAEAAVANEARNLLLTRITIGLASLLALSFALLVGSGARAHHVDHDLWVTWWSHHAEYDCCQLAHERCGPGVTAIVELRDRLHERDGSARERIAARVAESLGLADLDVSQPPADRSDLDTMFATCPTLASHASHEAARQR